MPFGLPSATVTTRAATAYNPDTCRLVSIDAGAKLEVLGMGADQDGAAWGEVICRDAKGNQLLVQKAALRL